MSEKHPASTASRTRIELGNVEVMEGGRLLVRIHHKNGDDPSIVCQFSTFDTDAIEELADALRMNAQTAKLKQEKYKNDDHVDLGELLENEEDEV